MFPVTVLQCQSFSEFREVCPISIFERIHAIVPVTGIPGWKRVVESRTDVVCIQVAAIDGLVQIDPSSAHAQDVRAGRLHRQIRDCGYPKRCRLSLGIVRIGNP